MLFQYTYTMYIMYTFIQCISCNVKTYYASSYIPI
nr:MAG TPA: hypothetical protein [Bacteriophage sp.]